MRLPAVGPATSAWTSLAALVATRSTFMTPRSCLAALVPWSVRVLVALTLAEFVRGSAKVLRAG